MLNDSFSSMDAMLLALLLVGTVSCLAFLYYIIDDYIFTKLYFNIADIVLSDNCEKIVNNISCDTFYETRRLFNITNCTDAQGFSPDFQRKINKISALTLYKLLKKLKKAQSFNAVIDK